MVVILKGKMSTFVLNESQASMKIGMSQLVLWASGVVCLREMSMQLLMIQKYFGVQSCCHRLFAITRKVKDHIFVRILILDDSSLSLIISFTHRLACSENPVLNPGFCL